MMNQRSYSFLKRFKTQRSDKITSRPNKTPVNKKQTDTRTPQKKETPEEIILNSRQAWSLKCLNHPNKKASFENKEHSSDTFCSECAIKLVKMNVRLNKLTEKSIYLRETFQKDLEKLKKYEEQLHSLVAGIFEQLRQKFEAVYESSNSNQNLNIQMPIINTKYSLKLDLENQLKTIIGQFSVRKVKLVQPPEIKIQPETVFKAKINLPKNKPIPSWIEHKENSNSTNSDSQRQNIVRRQGLLHPSQFISH